MLFPVFFFSFFFFKFLIKIGFIFEIVFENIYVFTFVEGDAVGSGAKNTLGLVGLIALVDSDAAGLSDGVDWGDGWVLLVWPLLLLVLVSGIGVLGVIGALPWKRILVIDWIFIFNQQEQQTIILTGILW